MDNNDNIPRLVWERDQIRASHTIREEITAEEVDRAISSYIIGRNAADII